MQPLDYNRNKPVTCFACEKEQTRARQGICNTCAAMLLTAQNLLEQIKADKEATTAFVLNGTLERWKGDASAPCEVDWKDITQAIGGFDMSVQVPYWTEAYGDRYVSYHSETPLNVAKGDVRLSNPERDSFRRDAGHTVTVPRQRAEAMARILIAFQNALARAYQEGVVKGSSLLGALTNGDMTHYDEARDEAIRQVQAGEAADAARRAR